MGRGEYKIRAEKRPGDGVHHLDMVFFVSFFAGIVWANLLGDGSRNRFFLLNEYYLQQIKYTKVDYNGLLVHILENRLPALLLLGLLSFTLAGILTQIFFVGYFGISFGFLCVMAITNFGAKGMVYLFGFLFPHYLFYLAGYLLFLRLFWKAKEGAFPERRQMLIQILLLGICMVSGILSESYVNPVFLQKLLKIF